MNPFDNNKILSHLDAVSAWKSGKTFNPICVGISMTDLCNHNCPACAGGIINKDSFAYSEAVHALSQFRELGAKAVIFGGGGEPLVNPATVHVINTITGWGMSAGLVTNGATTLSDENVSILMSKCSWVRVSLDACDAESYTLTHGDKANWSKTMSNIRRYTEFKDRKAVVGASYLTNKSNESGVEAAIKVAIDLRLDYLQFKQFNEDDYFPAETVEEMKAIYNTDSFKVYSVHKLDNYMRNYNRCHAVSFIADIAADGSVYPCCTLRSLSLGAKYTIGNVKTQTVKEIYNSKEFTNMLEMSVDGCPVYCKNHVLNKNLEYLSESCAMHSEFI